MGNVFEGLCAQAPTSSNIVLSASGHLHAGPLMPGWSQQVCRRAVQEEEEAVAQINRRGSSPSLPGAAGCYLLPSSSARGVTPPPLTGVLLYREVGSEGPP